MILRVAEGKCKPDEAAAWLPLASSPYDLPPDTETDMRLIANIITEQKWLLDELDRQ